MIYRKKYKNTFPPLCSFLHLQHIQLSKLSGAGCAKLALQDCLPAVTRKQSRAQQGAHVLGLAPKLGRSEERLTLTTGRLDEAQEDVHRNK